MLVVVAVVGVGFGLYWFQPWKLWQDETVQEALPGTAAASKAPVGLPSSGVSTWCDRFDVSLGAADRGRVRRPMTKNHSCRACSARRSGR
ncbi:hypothetical protein [Streptomyces sp. NBC_01092]|uniref:hypothetical protein n=1 Tax=Streptomyces sp. NBC_01092 TaxID=2903748 RepID=UPI00386B33C4